MKKPRYPDFYCVGVQKAGTTWLFENLRRLPAFWLPFLKEVDFYNYIHIPQQRGWIIPFVRERCLREIGKLVKDGFDSAANRNLAKQLLNIVDIGTTPIDEAWYANVFSMAPEGSVTGDITPEYSVLPEAGIEHLQRLTPDAKVIILFRDPVERALSHARMLMRDQPQINEADLLQRLASPELKDRSDYKAILTLWEKHIPADRLFIGFYDSIINAPVELLTAVTDFLNVKTEEENWPLAGSIIHQGRAVAVSKETKQVIAKDLYETIEYMRDRFPEHCSKWGEF